MTNPHFCHRLERSSNRAVNMCSINGTNPMTKDVNVVVSWLVEQGLEEYVTAFQNAG